MTKTQKRKADTMADQWRHQIKFNYYLSLDDSLLFLSHIDPNCTFKKENDGSLTIRFSDGSSDHRV